MYIQTINAIIGALLSCQQFRAFLVFLLVNCAACASANNKVAAPNSELKFSGVVALAAITAQVQLGPRPTGSAANQALRNWLVDELTALGWTTMRQPFAVSNVTAENIVAYRGQGRTIMLGTHFDTRMISDRDPDPAKRDQPGPGANDGASGVAVLLELARVLVPEDLGLRLCLAFFDAEDNGDIAHWDWALGSAHFVANPGQVAACDAPAAMLAVDMVGDRDLKIYRDFGSQRQLQRAVWDQAEALHFAAFNFNHKYAIVDDHSAFLAAGTPAAVIIDFEYPYWHTLQDTLDKVSAESLAVVGQTLEAWLKAGAVF